MTKRVAEMLGHSVNEEVWVRAGVIYGVPLLVTADDLAPQVNITWQFSTDPNVRKIAITLITKIYIISPCSALHFPSFTSLMLTFPLKIPQFWFPRQE
jgi:hypothetical protein